MAELKPIIGEGGDHCSPDCPYLAKCEHPYWHHTAWCWKQMRDLGWYDYWIADCVHNSPDERLVKIKGSGNTKAPE